MTPSSGLDPSLLYENFAFKATVGDISDEEQTPQLRSLIQTLGLQTHVEGGYFVETDRDSLRVPNPFLPPGLSDGERNALPEEERTRSASTSIFYLLTPGRPMGRFHRNKGRTVHTLHSGRGIYVLLHVDELEKDRNGKGNVRIESFVVGRNVEKGERLQWIVEGGKYKASFLLDVEEENGSRVDCAECGGLLISETVVPGFEFTDHDFLEMDRIRELVTPEQVKELEWLVRKE